MQIPWLFPDFSQYSFFPWPSTKFPDFSLTFAKSGISLTYPWTLDTLLAYIVPPEANELSPIWTEILATNIGDLWCITTHLLSDGRVNWPKLHDMFKACDAKTWQSDFR